MKPATNGIEDAKREVERTRRQFASTAGALQYRLKPVNLMSSAWDGVREKGSEMADGAIQTVKDRPVAASGILAAMVVFLARDPLWRLASEFIRRDEEEADVGVIQADLDHHEREYDLTAPAVEKSKKEGVKV
jgi:hypothetical protein